MKKWQKVTLAIAIILVLGGIGFFFYLRTFRNTPTDQPKSYQAPESTNPTQPANPASAYYYPISNYNERLTFRWFGKFVNNESVSPCGASFRGYHTADDLEILSGEKNTEVPVYAISDSSVRQIGPTSGYGGLMVLGTTINGNNYTLYYGHIDLTSSTLKQDDNVKAGQKIANLAPQCSAKSGGERKHLHFGIKKGNAVDVKGYVSNSLELNNWINPKNFLNQLDAKSI
jgi:murein DD-endopeptidase MepM/ murein hydrolase activator NlpD